MSIIARLWWRRRRRRRSSVDRPSEKGRRRRAPSRVRKITIRSIFQSFEGAKEGPLAGERKRGKKKESMREWSARIVAHGDGFRDFRSQLVRDSRIMLSSHLPRKRTRGVRLRYRKPIDVRTFVKAIDPPYINPVDSEFLLIKRRIREKKK